MTTDDLRLPPSSGTPVLLDDHAPVRADVPHEAPALDSARHVQRVGLYPRLVDAITSGEATVSAPDYPMMTSPITSGEATVSVLVGDLLSDDTLIAL